MHAESTQLVTAKLAGLRPTQITVGRIAVEQKVRTWKDMKKAARAKELADRWFPAVKGPGDAWYITDHHHHGVALLECGVAKVKLLVRKDLSALERKAFWMAMDHYGWVHPYGAKGRREHFRKIPDTLADLDDDPYRSLADHVQKLGGYAESDVPYAEFLWADYFRERIDIGKHAVAWDNAVVEALEMAHARHARCLPGWSGPDD
jgi:hypothetical protein